MNYIHDYSAVCELANGTWLIAGGADDLGVAPGNNTAEIYDPSDNSFTPCSTMTYQRCSLSAARLANGNALIVGGWYDATSATYGELFNATTKTFSATGALNTPRSNTVVIATNDTGAVVFGGYYYYGGTNYESVGPSIQRQINSSHSQIICSLLTVGGIYKEISIYGQCPLN